MNQPTKDRMRLTFLVFIVVMIFSLGALGSGVQTAQASPGNPPPPQGTPKSPTPTPTTGGGGGGVTETVIDIFHHLYFSAPTISDALNTIFGKVASDQSLESSKQLAEWTASFGNLVQAPDEGAYNKVAQLSLPVAAALAPALFILRLALYHWNKLLGDGKDTPMGVIGDWITAGLLALLCGPFLDMIVRLGWWMVGASGAIGNPKELALSFIQTFGSHAVTDSIGAIPGLSAVSFMDSLMSIVVSLSALLAFAGLLLAFASAQAVLFLLAVIGPPIAVSSVLDEMKWLRALWLKALIVVALLPLAAGAIFRAALALSGIFNHSGLLSDIIRVVWLLGGTGALLSITGILGRMTLGTSVDAIKGIAQAGGNILATAALATSGVGLAAVPAAAGAGGAGAATAGGAGGAAAAGGLPGAPATGGGSPPSGGLPGASSHLGAAQRMNSASMTLDSMGLGKAANFARGAARGHQLAAQQDELNERIGKFGNGSGARPGGAPDSAPEDLGFKTTTEIKDNILQGFKGNPDEFRSSYFGESGVAPLLEKMGVQDPTSFASQHSDEIGQMTRAFSRMQADQNGPSEDLVVEAAKSVGAHGILQALNRDM